MKINKRVVIESIFFSISMFVFAIALSMVQGYLLTKKYVPEITNNYESVEYLQNEVVFGVVYRPNWIVYIVGLLIVASAYYVIRLYILDLRRNSNQIK